MRPMGGVLGTVPAFGFAIEYQTLGPPHGHGNVHIANAYQYQTLYDIAEMIKKELLDPQTVLDYHAWLHREEPFDQAAHERERSNIEDAWRDRFDAPEHDAMSQTPAYMHHDRSEMWKFFKEETGEDSINIGDLHADAQRFHNAYTKDLQFIFSRVQHHFHK